MAMFSNVVKELEVIAYGAPSINCGYTRSVVGSRLGKKEDFVTNV